MTTIELQLPDDLVEKAQAAGLLAAETLEGILREHLRVQAGEELRALWNQDKLENLTPEMSDSINDIVREVRRTAVHAK